jgi:hypothetical protein
MLTVIMLSIVVLNVMARWQQPQTGIQESFEKYFKLQVFKL